MLTGANQILDETLSQTLAKVDVVWRGNGSWAQPGERVARRMVRFYPLKGESAVLQWGVSLSFVPRFPGSTASHHRTFRAAQMDVFEFPKSYNDSFQNPGSFLRIDTRPAFLERSLRGYFDLVSHEIYPWFERCQNLPDLERELSRQVTDDQWAYRIRNPQPEFVLAFVKAAMGAKREAEDVLRAKADWDGAELSAILTELERAKPIADGCRLRHSHRAGNRLDL